MYARVKPADDGEARERRERNFGGDNKHAAFYLAAKRRYRAQRYAQNDHNVRGRVRRFGLFVQNYRTVIHDNELEKQIKADNDDIECARREYFEVDFEQAFSPNKLNKPRDGEPDTIKFLFVFIIFSFAPKPAGTIIARSLRISQDAFRRKQRKPATLFVSRAVFYDF